MSKTIVFNYTGDCPYTNSPHSIKIDYFEILLAGKLKPGYKKSSYTCSLIDECPYPKTDKYGRCPVYLNSPNEPI